MLDSGLRGLGSSAGQGGLRGLGSSAGQGGLRGLGSSAGQGHYLLGQDVIAHSQCLSLSITNGYQ